MHSSVDQNLDEWLYFKDSDENADGKVVSYHSLEIPVDYTVSPSLKLIVFVNYENFNGSSSVTLGDSYTYQIEDCQRHKVSVEFSEKKVKEFLYRLKNVPTFIVGENNLGLSRKSRVTECHVRSWIIVWHICCG